MTPINRKRRFADTFFGEENSTKFLLMEDAYQELHTRLVSPVKRSQDYLRRRKTRAKWLAKRGIGITLVPDELRKTIFGDFFDFTKADKYLTHPLQRVSRLYLAYGMISSWFKKIHRVPPSFVIGYAQYGFGFRHLRVDKNDDKAAFEWILRRSRTTELVFDICAATDAFWNYLETDDLRNLVAAFDNNAAANLTDHDADAEDAEVTLQDDEDEKNEKNETETMKKNKAVTPSGFGFLDLLKVQISKPYLQQRIENMLGHPIYPRKNYRVSILLNQVVSDHHQLVFVAQQIKDIFSKWKVEDKVAYVRTELASFGLAIHPKRHEELVHLIHSTFSVDLDQMVSFIRISHAVKTKYVHEDMDELSVRVTKYVKEAIVQARLFAMNISEATTNVIIQLS